MLHRNAIEDYHVLVTSVVYEVDGSRRLCRFEDSCELARLNGSSEVPQMREGVGNVQSSAIYGSGVNECVNQLRVTAMAESSSSRADAIER